MVLCCFCIPEVVSTVTNDIDPDLQSTKGSLKSHFEFLIVQNHASHAIRKKVT